MELLAFGKTGWGDELFYATLMTIAVSVTAMLIGFVFALIFTPLKLSKYKFLNLIGNFYTTVIRGVPELLVIYLFFFGGSGANSNSNASASSSLASVVGSQNQNAASSASSSRNVPDQLPQQGNENPEEVTGVSREERRRQAAEAAEKRMNGGS